MEKVQGTELENLWPSMPIKDRFAVVEAISEFQNAWASVSFKKFGSLYYAKDLNQSTRDEPLYVDSNGLDVVKQDFCNWSLYKT